MELGGRGRQTLDEPHCVTRVDARPPAGTDVLQVLRQRDPCSPGQDQIDAPVASFPFDGTWKPIIFQAAEHTQALLGRRPCRQRLENEMVSPWSAQGIKCEIAFAKRSADSLQEKILAAADSAAVEIGAATAINQDGWLRAAGLGTT
jgi:hypothetical protein